MAVTLLSAHVIKWLGAVSLLVIVTPLATGLFRGFADVGASADTTDAPYQAAELVRALDFYRNGYGSFGVRNIETKQSPSCFDVAAASSRQPLDENGMAALEVLDSLLGQRRASLDDVRVDVVLRNISRPIIGFYTSCIRDSVFAALCANAVERLLGRGLKAAKRSRAALMAEVQRTEDYLTCAFFAGASALAAKSSPGAK